MKHLDLDWEAFLETLPLWERLPVPARGTVLAIYSEHGLNAVVPRGLAGPVEGLLLAAHVFVPAASRAGFKLADRQRLLVRGLLALGRTPMFETEAIPPLLAYYLKEHLTLDECDGLVRYSSSYDLLQTTVAVAGSTSWLQGFLESPSAAAWEKDRLGRRSTRRPVLDDPEVAAALRLLLERLIAAGGPVPLGDLVRQLGEVSSAVVNRALTTGLRYALFLGGLSPDFRPLVGLWPPLQQRLSAPPPTPPTTVTPQETLVGGYGLDDLFTILAACKARPPRLRQQDGQLFAKAEEEMIAQLAPLPEWAEREMPAALVIRRLFWALRVLSIFELTQTVTRPGKGSILEVSPAGDRFLAMSRRDRLRFLCPPGSKWPASRPNSYVPAPFPFDFHPERPAPDEIERLAAAFGSLPEKGFVDLDAFIRFQGRQHNPWRGATGSGPRDYGVPVTVEEQEEVWMERLSMFFVLRLIPLGGAILGRTGEDSFSLALTPIGRAILGRTGDFETEEEAPARIVVQPNFEIVFLTPAAETEADFARFAERKGRGVGTLFRITRPSILAAAAAGLDARKVLALLEARAVQAIPVNVRREVEAWFGRVRTVVARPSYLVICPDAETAARVVAAGGKSTRLLSEDTVELQDVKQREALIKKLREDGVFVSETEEPARPEKKPAPRRRRRYY